MSKLKVGVVGAAGIVGLGTIARLAEVGYPTVGYDINADAVARLNNGRMPEGNTNKKVEEMLPLPNTLFTSDPADLEEVNIYIICVPTHVDKTTFRYVTDHLVSAVEDFIPYLRSKDIVVIESTVDKHALNVVRDTIKEKARLHKVHLVHCPEFINPGGEDEWTVGNIPRPIGADTEHAKRVACELYSLLTSQGGDIRLVDSPDAAAHGKIYTNAYRSINIAEANQMAILCERNGDNVWNMLDAADKKPFGYEGFSPGPGLGGHCVGVDEKTFLAQAREIGFNLSILEAAVKVNEGMPAYVADTIGNILDATFTTNNGRVPKVTILGLAYKEDLAEDRESPAYKVSEEISNRDKLRLTLFDPHIPSKSSEVDLDAALKDAHLVVLITPHKEFRQLTAIDFKEHGVEVVYDTRNVYDKEEFDATGIELVTLGVGHAYSPATASVQTREPIEELKQ